MIDMNNEHNHKNIVVEVNCFLYLKIAKTKNSFRLWLFVISKYLSTYNLERVSHLIKICRVFQNYFGISNYIH